MIDRVDICDICYKPFYYGESIYGCDKEYKIRKVCTSCGAKLGVASCGNCFQLYKVSRKPMNTNFCPECNSVADVAELTTIRDRVYGKAFGISMNANECPRTIQDLTPPNKEEE